MEAIFDHEKLDVYGLQLQFVAWTADFLIEASQSPVAHRRELLSQLDRACLSILLNSAEGNGKRHGLQCWHSTVCPAGPISRPHDELGGRMQSVSLHAG